MAIPKILHYVWFNKAKGFPEKIRRCMASWKKYAPDWEIKCWNENTFDVNLTPWTKECYETGEWAYGFLVDYIKPWCLYNYGGVYVDTDYEFTQPIDSLLNTSCFFGKENPKKMGTAIIGSEKNNPLMKSIMDFYQNRHFVKEAIARFNFNSIYIYTNILAQHGFTFTENTEDNVFDGVTFYNHQKLYGGEYGVHHNTALWTKSTAFIILYSNDEDNIWKNLDACHNNYGQVDFLYVNLRSTDKTSYIINEYIKTMCDSRIENYEEYQGEDILSILKQVVKRCCGNKILIMTPEYLPNRYDFDMIEHYAINENPDKKALYFGNKWKPFELHNLVFNRDLIKPEDLFSSKRGLFDAISIIGEKNAQFIDRSLYINLHK